MLGHESDWQPASAVVKMTIKLAMVWLLRIGINHRRHQVTGSRRIFTPSKGRKGREL
jgi:hypothetical protein